MPNRLAKETSPYLLQHAHNPVDWYPWGEQALERAQKENKPILVSIGYAACHWCHVMEKESFEDGDTASLMNENFVNIKIDREERPDLDHIYMDAVQTMTGSGGWPLNVFLTPTAKPFYGGTYFPPRRAFNRPSWREVLTAVSNAFREKRNEIELQAESLTAHLSESKTFGQQQPGEPFTREKSDQAFQNLLKTADKEWGGFGSAPKFPQTFSIQFLLRYHYVTGNEEALTQACLSIDKMIEGGIYDQVGGGFARYSTDTEWLVPHFEKMLYDNALLVSVLAEAYQLTKNPRYREVIEETIAFIQRELTDPGGGFYSALDADSEGEEGKFYVWKFEEVKNLLNNGEIFCEFFDITETGNWSEGTTSENGKSILRTKKPLELFAKEKNITPDELRSIIKEAKSILLAERNNRVRPALDDKIILSWNALMNTACSKAFAATGKDEYLKLAVANMQFLLEKFATSNHSYFHHTWKHDEAKYFAFLDDYAFIIQALLHLQEITADAEWLIRAKEIAENVIENFSEDETGFFFFTDVRQTDIIFRKKEIYDGATPSGNATMAYNIYQLSILFNIPEYRARAENMIRSLTNTIIRSPTSFGVWINFLLETTFGTMEIAVVGDKPALKAKEVLAQYFPHKVLMASENGIGNLPLLAGKKAANPPLIYLCKDYSCLKPVSGVNELIRLIDTGKKIDK